MPNNVFGTSSSSYDNGNKIDTSLFIIKSYLRTNYIGSIIERDNIIRNQYRFKHLPDPISIREQASKNYVEKKFNDPSIIENTTHVDFNDKNLDNLRFVKKTACQQFHNILPQDIMSINLFFIM